MEGIVNNVGDGTSVSGVEAHPNGLLEVDVHLEVDDLACLDDGRASKHTDVQVGDLVHFVLQDSEAPEVLRVLKAVHLCTAVWYGRAHQIFALHCRRIGLHVLDKNKPNLGARISVSLRRLGRDVDVSVDLNLTDFDLATDSVIERCSRDGRTQVERVRNGGGAEVDCRGGVNFGVGPVRSDRGNRCRTEVPVHVLHLRVNLTASSASNTPFGKKVLLAGGNLGAPALARLLVRWERTSSTPLHFHKKVLAYLKARFLIRKVGLVRIGALLLLGRGRAHLGSVSISLGD